MKFGVVVFPGSNCDDDMVDALENLGQKVVKLWHKEKNLQGCDFIVLPGGFSYGDYLRTGAIARFSPIMSEIVDFAEKGGFVLGICNGFQILTEAGLLPGVLLKNTSQKYICKNVFIRPQNDDTLITYKLPRKKAYKIPIAHGEGRFYAPEKELQEILANGQVIFRYCDENGNITKDANPNGSLENIAGICNKKGNVMGMMPHPERASNALLGNTDGEFLLKSIIETISL
ncbi:phosphoribosylformylglycinamidine synthase I [Raineya orbicola]|jgi:phosphoribosylformylglycinamidine synthase|uniref:Phosphoribosylformylglycinamidine synthase subunit PurQ n=1 Tax=Raineya orbicola TaxID=2016530 RepID=A0A2N3IKE9_9BACT|nr:phosphoribosylformylglycinamidine synthase I [Raineya orbicola]PKQ70802.1 Phosphoribosylformylglycinamidine synthase I [Raineya orbicola]